MENLYKIAQKIYLKLANEVFTKKLKCLSNSVGRYIFSDEAGKKYSYLKKGKAIFDRDKYYIVNFTIESQAATGIITIKVIDSKEYSGQEFEESKVTESKPEVSTPTEKPTFNPPESFAIAYLKLIANVTADKIMSTMKRDNRNGNALQNFFEMAREKDVKAFAEAAGSQGVEEAEAIGFYNQYVTQYINDLYSKIEQSVEKDNQRDLQNYLTGLRQYFHNLERKSG